MKNMQTGCLCLKAHTKSSVALSTKFLPAHDLNRLLNCRTWKCVPCEYDVHKLAMLPCRYKQEFGFVIPGRKILVDDVRIRGIGRTRVRIEQTIPRATGEPVPDMVGVRALS